MKMRMPFAIVAALGLNAAPAPAGDVAAGEDLYAAACAHCHGRTGRGMASFPPVSGKSADHIAERLTQYRAGKQIGPNSALMISNSLDLCDDDIANLAAYISTTFD